MATKPYSEDQKQAIQDTTQAVQDAARKTVEQSGNVVQAAADANRRAAQASTEIMQRNAETLQQAVQSGAKLAARVTERTTDQFGRLLGFSGEEARNAAHKSSDNIETIAQSTAVLAEMGQRLTADWMELAQEHIERSFNRLDDLLRARTSQDVATIQSELIRDNLETFLKYVRRTSEKSVRMVDEASNRFSETVRQGLRAA
jgi:hypothetical protein